MGAATPTLHFTLTREDGAVTEELSLPQDAGVLGLQAGGALPSGANVPVIQSATNTYKTTVQGLPDKLTVVVASNSGKIQTEYAISWRMTDGNPYAGYWRNVSDEEPDVQYMHLLSEVTFRVVGNTGGVALDQAFSQEQANDLVLRATVNNQPALGDSEVVGTVQDALKSPLPGNSENALDWLAGNPATSGVLSGSLPAYDKQGRPIEYSIAYQGAQEGSDYYQAVYDNEQSANHGTDTTAAFSGGTLTLIHVGETTFDATKQWLDVDASGRQELTFTLWRYSARGGNDYSTAAQARLVPVQGQGQGNADAAAPEFATITASANLADDQGKIDLGKLIEEKYGKLPKFDSDGYPYIYALREDTSVAGYEMLLGAVGADGTMNDTAPTYRNADGTSAAAPGGWTRSAADRFTYDRGTVTNRRSGTATCSFTKSWIAAAFQSQLENVTCTFQAQSRLKGSDDVWTAVAGSEATVNMTDWIAEYLTREHTGTFPQYDSLGRELEYRWVEVSVQQDGGVVQDLASQTSDPKTFVLKLHDAFGEPIDVTFESRINQETGAIENVIQNTTDEYVEIIWMDGDKKLDGPGDGSKVTLRLYRDRVQVGVFELDGTVGDLNAEPIDGVSFTAREDQSWHLALEGLPAYSPEGQVYSYVIVEDDVTGWHSTRVYDPAQHLTTITNTKGEGVSTDIPVSKLWLDESDVAHRLPSVVGVYAKEGKTDAHGNQISQGQFMGYALQIAVDQADGTYQVSGLPKYDAQGAVSNYVLEESMENGGAAGEDRYVSSRSEQPYQVGDRHFHDKLSIAYTNLRTGTKDVVFHKEWKDAYVNEVLNQRPDIYLTLYTVDDAGAPQPVTSYVQSQWTADDPGDASVKHQTCTITDLPKYNSEGQEVFYYAVERMSANAEALGYVDVRLEAPEDSPATNPIIDVAAGHEGAAESEQAIVEGCVAGLALVAGFVATALRKRTKIRSDA